MINDMVLAILIAFAAVTGRSADWFKSKNLACAAVKRGAEEDWEK